MLRRTYVLAISAGSLVAAAGGVVAGCQGIAGLRDLEYQQARTTCSQVVLPSTGNGRIRLVNAGTAGASVDFCIRTSGSSDWGSPVFHVDGDPVSCPGLAYADATLPFAVPAGSIDVKAIAAGSPCSATALSEADGIAVGDSTATPPGPVITVLRMAGGSSPEQVVSHVEEPNPSTATGRVRFIDALSGNQSITVGLTQGITLPMSLSNALPEPIAPGGIAAPSPGTFGPIDSAGYASILPGIDVGGAFAGQLNAFFAFQTFADGDTVTAITIGDARDTLHPPRAMICVDALPITAGDAGATSYSAGCSLTALPSLVVDTLNTSLYGSASPFESQRRPYVYKAIAARTSDFMCLLETSSDADKAAIAAAASGQFPYAFYPTTNLDTAPNDPAQLDGAVPPPPSGPACTASDVSAAIACATPCVTNDAGGPIETTECLSKSCLGPLGGLRYGSLSQQQCFDCLVYYFASVPLSAAQACATDPRQQFSFAGATSSMLLSRYPLSNTKAYIFPGTGYRHAVLYAQAAVGDQNVDVYCTQLISPLVGASLPYLGNYGAAIVDGGVVDLGWEGEQDLQVGRAIDFIKSNSKSTGNPAIIAGDWHATLPAGANGGATLTSQSPEVMLAMDQAYGGAFVRAEPAGYQAVCEYCPPPQNPYNAGALPEDFTPTFLLGFPSNATISDTLFATEDVVPIVPGLDESWTVDGGGPIAEYYGREIVLVRPPPK